jgi:hypothetical protein
VLTSAGLDCGAVLENPPVVHRRKPRRTRTPTPPSPPERHVVGTTGGRLPFTGATLVPSILAGSLLLAGGMLLRRRTRLQAPAASPAAVLPAPESTAVHGPAADRGMVTPAVRVAWALLAVGLLARQRRRR